MALYPVVPRDYQGWQQPVLDILNDPPGSPTEGQRYLINNNPTGAWVGHWLGFCGSYRRLVCL